MSFVSTDFAILFLSILFLLWVVKNPTGRKLILLTASCIFYAYWDWRFLGLLGFVTVMDYFISKNLVDAGNQKVKKSLLILSVVINLGLLGFFKYFNFFVTSLDALLAPLHLNLRTLDIILPIGISFYTFETLSYVIDVYRGTAQPAQSILDYAVFITFFPRLVSGPIMRASQFLPQLERGIVLNLDNIVTGAQLFLRGLLKKVVVADNLAVMVDQIYAAPSVFSSPTVWLAIGAYSIQIFCDFSGYTDMAMGLGKMLGFSLPQNFNLPYTAQSITEFWNRWHISLSTWLRDYLYIPLGGNRKGTIRTYINLMITMLLGGLWHGASWNFVLWGGLQGAYLALERIVLGQKPKSALWTSPAAWVRASLTFLIVTVSFVPFRSPSWATTLTIFKKLAFVGVGNQIQWYFTAALAAIPFILAGGMLARRFKWQWPILPANAAYTPAVILFQALLVFFLAPINTSPFIYFQF